MDRELYALSSDRSAAFALRFLDTFTPGGGATADEYLVPEHTDWPTESFAQVEELLAHLENNPSEPYAVYWRAHRDAADVRMAMLFYTDDGFVILGLAVDESFEAAQMARLKAFADAEFTVAWDEQAPPRSAVEFRAMCAA